ncbi:hypothetical protein [Azospirillum griseum]|uniref:hypothetical protein n=1 Tax=Azospirillum griseum TaxID=2496639 RepID=UPI001FEAA57A|nr:hypothetical protein [Azospirillum griseum]
MLREAFEYWTTPCRPQARRLGYLAEAVALGARHRRQRLGWEPHAAACRRFITQAAALAPAGGRAAVIGSGLLIEIPLDALRARFDEVLLIDMVHTRSVRRRTAGMPNVRLIELDVTGALDALDAALTAKAGALPTGFAPPALPGPRAEGAPNGAPLSFAVSCNLLSQLPLMPLDAIDRRAPTIPDAERLAFAQRLATDHLRWLAGLATRAALFSDTESLWIRNGVVEEREDSLWGLSLPAPDAEWLWDIAPAPEQERDRDQRHRVGGWLDVSGLVNHPMANDPNRNRPPRD